MNCGNCEHVISAANADKVTVEDGGHNDLEVRLDCPHCGQGFYGFVPLSELVLDTNKPGDIEKALNEGDSEDHAG